MVQPHIILCHMTDLASTSAAGARIARETDKLDLVCCNAGIIATPAGLTKDSWEVQIGANHLGHAMLRYMKQLMLLCDEDRCRPC